MYYLEHANLRIRKSFFLFFFFEKFHESRHWQKFILNLQSLFSRQEGLLFIRMCDVLKLGTKGLPSIEPFDDLNPMINAVEITQQEQLLFLCISPREDIEAHCQPEIEDSESEWEEESNAFDVIENLQLLSTCNKSSFCT